MGLHAQLIDSIDSAVSPFCDSLRRCGGHSASSQRKSADDLARTLKKRGIYAIFE